MAADNDLDFMPDARGEASPDDFFAAIKYEIFTTLRVCIPATVKAWTPAVPNKLPATVDVQLDFLRTRSINNAGELLEGEELLDSEAESLRARGPVPTLRRVPIACAGNPAMNQRGRIPNGTTGFLLVADRCLDQWKNTGGPLDSATADKHDYNDGFFLPTVYHGGNTPESPTASQQFGPDDGSAGLEIIDADKSISLKTTGTTATVDATSDDAPAAARILLGAAAALAAFRTTDPVNPGANMAAWALVVETAINVLAPGTFTPANSFATTIAPPNTGNFGSGGTGSAKTLIE